jgi:tetratricopeptide (TPR) repeat protein
VEGYDYRADVWKAKGNVERALADYEMAIRLDPTYAAAYYRRGRTNEDRGDIEKARADYNAALAVPEKDRIAKCAQDQARERLRELGN